MPKYGPPPDYGALLGGQSPFGSPPPVQAPLPPMPTPQAPTPGPMAGPPPMAPQAQQVMQHAAEQAQKKAFEDHMDNFLKALAADYASGKIGREDLKKGASYQGLQPYADWKKENVTHLKAAADAQGN